MTRDGLVERSADSGEEIRISEREQDFDLRQARDSPVYEDMSAEARRVARLAVVRTDEHEVLAGAEHLHPR